MVFEREPVPELVDGDDGEDHQEDQGDGVERKERSHGDEERAGVHDREDAGDDGGDPEDGRKCGAEEKTEPLFQQGQRPVGVEGVEFDRQQVLEAPLRAPGHAFEPGPAIGVIQQQQVAQFPDEVLQLVLQDFGPVFFGRLGGDGGQVPAAVQKLEHRCLDGGEAVEAAGDGVFDDDAGGAFGRDLEIRSQFLQRCCHPEPRRAVGHCGDIIPPGCESY